MKKGEYFSIPTLIQTMNLILTKSYEGRLEPMLIKRTVFRGAYKIGVP